jgi:flagellar basal body-associated protein FliL
MPLDLLTALPLDVLQLAHDTNVPHQETRSGGGGGGVNVILIVVGVVVTLALLGTLFWLKGRMQKLDEREDEQASAGAEPAG